MSFAQVSLVFLVQMAFGSMATFLFTDRDALGPKYFKFGGWVLGGLFGLALTLTAGSLVDAGASAAETVAAWSILAAAVGMLAFSSVSGWDRPGLETALLWFSLVAAGVGVHASALPFAATTDGAASSTLLVSAGAFGSALVLGFTTWGMILGHWYLVAQGLDIRHLGRLVAPLPWLLGLKALLSAVAMFLLWDRFLGPGVGSVDDLLAYHPERIVDVVNLWARIPVGLLVPAVLALMTKVTVRMEKTQPATGILYAMCVLVYLGDLMGKMVEGGTGVPY